MGDVLGHLFTENDPSLTWIGMGIWLFFGDDHKIPVFWQDLANKEPPCPDSKTYPRNLPFPPGLHFDTLHCIALGQIALNRGASESGLENEAASARHCTYIHYSKTWDRNWWGFDSAALHWWKESQLRGWQVVTDNSMYFAFAEIKVFNITYYVWLI